jgi:hypothetical protein
MSEPDKTWFDQQTQIDNYLAELNGKMDESNRLLTDLVNAMYNVANQLGTNLVPQNISQKLPTVGEVIVDPRDNIGYQIRNISSVSFHYSIPVSTPLFTLLPGYPIETLSDVAVLSFSVLPNADIFDMVLGVKYDINYKGTLSLFRNNINYAVDDPFNSNGISRLKSGYLVLNELRMEVPMFLTQIRKDQLIITYENGDPVNVFTGIATIKFAVLDKVQ